MKSFNKLNNRDCRYVIQDNPRRFCADPAHPGESWCEAHCRVVFRVWSPKRRREMLFGPFERIDTGPLEAVEAVEHTEEVIPDLIETMAA